MRKIIITLLALNIINNLFAQQGLHVGLMGNFNTVWIANQNAYGGEEYDYKITFGGGGGAAAGYNFTDNIGVQLDALLSTQGQKYMESAGGTNEREVKLNYFIIPLLFQYVSGGDGAKFYANLGPEFGFLQKATLVFNGQNSVGTERFNSTDVGIRMGLGGNIPLTDALYVTAGMDFMLGITDINDSDWQFGTPQNPYAPSRNVTAGAAIGIYYMFEQ